MKENRDENEKVDLFELKKELDSAENNISSERFQEICVQVAKEVERTGGGEIWFKPKEEREKVLKITVTELMGNEKGYSSLSGITLEKLVRTLGVFSLNRFKGIGGERAAKIVLALREKGFDVPQA